MRTLMATIDEMTGYQFEDYAATLMKELGFRVLATPRARDGGADLVVSKAGYLAVLQVKRWSGQVDRSAVKEVLRARLRYGARHAVVLTNSDFTRDTIELADNRGVELWDRTVLQRLIEVARSGNSA